MKNKFAIFFDDEKTLTKDARTVLGGKGYGLAEMTRLGLPVPYGFTIPTYVGKALEENGFTIEHKAALASAMLDLEDRAGEKFGDGGKLLVSVRSGSAVSMPGMLDTVLKVGTYVSLHQAILEVFKSWSNPRARTYRRIHDIDENLGTACTVQIMVLGDKNAKSGSGVVFTRNPNTGKRELYGEYVVKATGEGLVGGEVTPEPIVKLQSLLPKVYEKLVQYAAMIEDYFCDMQDIEFTVEDSKLYLLQCRSGKRSDLARVRIALDMVSEKLITVSNAIGQVTPELLSRLTTSSLDRTGLTLLTTALGASPGVAVGKIAFSSEDAAGAVPPVLLVREETSPDDIHGIECSSGVLTFNGGTTSHAAVVTRGMGKPCVVGAGSLSLSTFKDSSGKYIKSLTNGKVSVKEGEWLSIDGRTGEVFLGQGKVVHVTPVEVSEFAKLTQSEEKVG